MIIIKKNTDKNFTSIRAIANEVWPDTYGSILSKEQFDYMMEMMYSITSLQIQASVKNHHFILATENDNAVGFASYEFNCNGKTKTKIHKIYILTPQQRKGTGKKLIDFITGDAIQNHQKTLGLNVNRHNNAKYFYEKMGFIVKELEDIQIGNGYLMEDYVMEKSI